MSDNRHNRTAQKPDPTCRKRHRQGGYSLLEILIALTIISALTALVAPRLFNQVDRSKTVTTRVQAKELKQTLQLLHLDIGRFPTEAEGLDLLQEPMTAGALWQGPYLDGNLPMDAWGNPFQYRAPSSATNGAPQVFSLGADNAPGGSGQDEDIYG